MAKSKKCEKCSFVVFQDWASFLMALPDAEAADLARAIFAEGMDDEYEIKNMAVKAYFDAVIRPDMIENKRNRDQYREEQKKRGSEGGKSSAAKRKASANQTLPSANQTLPSANQTLSECKQSQAIYGDGDGDGNGNGNGDVDNSLQSIPTVSPSESLEKTPTSDISSPSNEGSDISPVGAKEKRFKPPTVDEVRDYCTARGNAVDAERFVSHYESNGWMVGKNRMKDWKAAVRTWERSSRDKPRESAYMNAIRDRVDIVDSWV